MISSARLPAGPRPWNYFLPVSYYLIYPFFPAFFLRFATIFPKEKLVVRSPQIQTLLIYLPAVVFVILFQVFHLRALSSGNMDHYREYFRVFTFHRCYLVVFFLLAMAALVHSYFTAESGSEKDKVRWILWGIAVGCAPFILLWTVPQIFGKPQVVPEEITYLAMIVTPLAFAFAIVKYHAFNIEVIINRSLVYGLLTGLIVGLYLLLVGLAGDFLLGMSPRANNFVAILCTLLAAVLFNPAKQKIQNYVDKTFYRIKYNYRLATKEFSLSLVTANAQIEVLDLLIKKIHATVPVDKIAILLHSNGVFEVVTSRGLSEEEKALLHFEESAELVQLARRHAQPLARKGRADSSAVADLPPLVALDCTAMEILLPVGLSTGRWGFLLLGRKLSGSRYSEEDLELLSTLSAAAFNALERIRFHEVAIQERAEREKLEELSRLKSEFISHVSHELRTPLTAIRWSVENLLDGIPESPTPKVREYLAGIHDCGAHLSRMIDNLLDVTKIEADKLEIFPERLRLAEVIPATVQAIAPVAGKKNVRIQVEEMGDLHVRADRDALQQILCNLIENAIKFSPKGQAVLVSAKIAGADESRLWGREVSGMVALSVRDYGIGIPADKQKAIFERFERVSREKAAREKGLGLGLYIAKKLAEAQGGTIGVESQEGVGSTFTFTLLAA